MIGKGLRFQSLFFCAHMVASMTQHLTQHNTIFFLDNIYNKKIMKTMKKLLRKLLIWILTENNTIEFNNKMNVKGSISASGDIVSYSTSKVNNEEITKK